MPLTAAVSRSHPSEATTAFLEEHNIQRRVPRGSSLKFCGVARGEADVYPRPNPTCLWDTAAGTIVAREAGCRVTDMAGADLLHDLSAGIKHNGFLVIGPRFAAQS
jgi:3'(2'), 5'-bisphosphate nucleotidase